MQSRILPVTTPTTSGLRLDVMLVSLFHACFPLSLGERLRLDVRLVSLSFMRVSLRP